MANLYLDSKFVGGGDDARVLFVRDVCVRVLEQLGADVDALGTETRFEINSVRHTLTFERSKYNGWVDGNYRGPA